MNTTRRQFVATSVASLPVLLCAPDPELRAAAQTGTDDPVLDQISADVLRAYEELRENPRRVDSLRAFEAALRYHATYATAVHFDEAVKRGLKKQITAQGRQGLLEAVVNDDHARHRREAELRKRFPGFTPDARVPVSAPILLEDATAALELLERHGLAPSLHAMANQIKGLHERLAKSQPIVNVALVKDPSECLWIEQALRALEAMAGVICMMSMAQPEFIPACMALGMDIVMYQVLALICNWF